MNIPLNIDWQQILLHLLNFVILAGGLYLLLYKPVKTFMEKRQQYYQEQDAKAAKTLADAEKTAAEVRQQLKNADADAAAKLAAAQKSAAVVRRTGTGGANSGGRPCRRPAGA